MKCLSLLLVVLLLLSLASCGKTPNSSAAPVTTPVAESSPTPVSTEPPAPSTVPAMPAEQQKQLLMDHYDEWAYKDPWDSPWFYTFTDLDHNDRLEVIAATLQGTGLYTYAQIWEVNSDYSGIAECPPAVEEEGMSYPDIITDSLPCFFDASDSRFYYICEDTTRNGFAEHYSSINAICLHDGLIEIRTLAGMHEIYSDPESNTPEVSYYDGEGNNSTKELYKTAVETAFGDMEKSTVSVEWIQVENPWPEEDPSEWIDPAEPEVVITKNPRSETVAAGGKTWFIAHADNAVSITWQAVNPDGYSVSLEKAMEANPGLSLEALEGDTIAVSNIPLSFDGWGIQARFDGSGDSNYAVTDPARITVTK